MGEARRRGTYQHRLANPNTAWHGRAVREELRKQAREIIKGALNGRQLRAIIEATIRADKR